MERMMLPQIAKKLEKYILALPAAKQFNTLSNEPRKAMMDLSDSAYSLRINTERYFAADDTEEQKMFIEAAKDQARRVDEYILLAGQHELLGPADVAHLGALNELILEKLG